MKKSSLIVVSIIIASLCAGCQQSGSKGDGPDSGEPERTWAQFVIAMSEADRSTMQQLSSTDAYVKIVNGTSLSPLSDTELKQLGSVWRIWPLRLRTEQSDKKEYTIGPEIKEHIIILSRTKHGWQVSGWAAGF